MRLPLSASGLVPDPLDLIAGVPDPLELIEVVRDPLELPESRPVTERPDLIEIRLESSLADGTVIDDGSAPLEPGDQFTVDIHVRETEDAFDFKGVGKRFYGIFQAFVDLHYDPQVVEPQFEQISYGTTFTSLTKVQLDSEAGVIRDLGGVDSTYIGKVLAGESTLSQTESLIASIPFTALSSGDPAIVPTSGQSNESFLGLGFDDPIPSSDVVFRFNPFTIPAPAADNSDNVSSIDPPVLEPIIEPPEPIISVDEPEPGSSPIAISTEPGDESDLSVLQRSDLVQLTFDSLSARRGSDERFVSQLEYMRLRGDLDRLSLRDLYRRQIAGLLELVEERRDASTSAGSSSPRQPLARDQKVAEDRQRFWREFDLELLDDEQATSPMELQFRWYRLRLADRDEPARQSGDGDRRDEEPDVPSILDLGLADITAWLLDTKYRSWLDPDSLPPQSKTDSTAADAEKTAPHPPAEAPATWSPRANVAIAARLELVEEARHDPLAVHAELMRKFRGESLDHADANTAVPAGEQVAADVDPPVAAESESAG